MEKFGELKIYESVFYNANDIIILLSTEGKIMKVNKKAMDIPKKNCIQWIYFNLEVKKKRC